MAVLTDMCKLLLFISVLYTSNAQMSLRGKKSSVPIRDYNKDRKRHLLDDTQRIPVIIYPFSLTISPTAQPLQQFQIDEIGENIESLVLSKLSSSGDAALGLVSSIQLNGVSSVTFTPSERIDEWRIQKSKSVLEFKTGMAQTHYSIYHDTPTSYQLAVAIESILKENLLTSIKTNVDGLEWVQQITVAIHLPYSSTLSPTASPTSSPVQPTASPIQPTSSPVQPTASPVKITHAPTARPTWEPSTFPSRSTFAPVVPTLSPTIHTQPHLKGISTAAPTLTPTVQVTAATTFELSSVNNSKNNVVAKQENSIVKVSIPIIWGALSCIIFVMGFLVLKIRRNRLYPKTCQSTLMYEKDSFDEDGDSTRTPDTMMDIHPSPLGSPKSNGTSTVKEADKEPSLENEIDTIVSVTSGRSHGPTTSISNEPFPNVHSSNKENFGRVDETLPSEMFPITFDMNEPTLGEEKMVSSSEKLMKNRNIDYSELKQAIPSCQTDLFTPCSGIFFQDEESFDQAEHSSVFLNSCATSSIFEHCDESDELWETKDDQSTSLEHADTTLSETENRRRVNSTESASDGDVNEFLLDDSWDPDDTDSASESPSFGVPQFEPVYDRDSNSCSGNPTDDQGAVISI